MKAMRIGGRLRRLRQERRLTQAQMARELGISASYLTLLESNQRPVTVRVLLRLVEKFHVDLKEFAADTDQRLSLELMEAFSDPIFESAEVKASDVQELVATLPAVGRAVLDLYGAYRRHLPAERARRAPATTPPRPPPVTIPSEEVTEFIQRRLNYFPETRGGRRAAVGRERPRHPHPAAGTDRAPPPALLRRRRDPPRRPDAGALAPLRPARPPARDFRDAAAVEPALPDRPPDRLPRLSTICSTQIVAAGRLLQRGGERAAAHRARQLFRRRGAHALPALPRRGARARATTSRS